MLPNISKPTATKATTPAPFQKEKIAEIPESEKVISVEVKSHTNLNGLAVKPGETHKITVKQWRALSRHFRWIDGPAEHNPSTWNPPAPDFGQTAKYPTA